MNADILFWVDILIKKLVKTTVNTPFDASDLLKIASSCFDMGGCKSDLMTLAEPTVCIAFSYSFVIIFSGVIYLLEFPLAVKSCSLICRETSFIIGIATEFPICLYSSLRLEISWKISGKPIIR